MSATKTGEANGIVTNDMLADILEEEPETRLKAARKERAAFVPDAAVVETCRKAFESKGGFAVPRAFATASDARKATNLLLRHAVIAAEYFADDKGKPKTASRTVVAFSDAYRATHAWAATATGDQFRVAFRLTFTKAKKEAATETAATAK